jgi:hypothetical protein
MSLRWPLVLVMSLSVGACVMGPAFLFYMPAEVPVSMDRCIQPGRYEAQLFDRDGVTVYLLSDPAVTPFRGTLRIRIPEGKAATFLDARIKISRSGSDPQTFGFWSPWCQTPDRIQGPRNVECDFATSVSDLQELVVTVPPVEINGSRYDVRPILFSLQVIAKVCPLIVARVSDSRTSPDSAFDRRYRDTI